MRATTRDSRFWILAVSLVAHGAATSIMTVHLVGYLTSRGHPATFAATVAGLLGILSVTGRLIFTGARQRVRTTTVLAGGNPDERPDARVLALGPQARPLP